MSLVGPRPLTIQYLPYYSEEERHRHDVRPAYNIINLSDTEPILK